MNLRACETANIGERLLAKGQTIVYRVNGDLEKPIVKEYPDGLRTDEQGNSYEAEPYIEVNNGKI